MARFFMAGGNFAGGTVLITGADADHAKVLRLKVGDHIVICDGDKTDHLLSFLIDLLRVPGSRIT